MTGRRVLEIGGVVAGVLMIAIGIGALALSISARNTVSDEIKREKIVGSPDMSPTEIQKSMQAAGLQNVSAPSCDVADQSISDGDDARCFARYMRVHALLGSGGLTFAQMGRFVAASDPTDPKGTNDQAAAATDASDKPVANAARNSWVTATSLATALNVSYMAQQIALFGLVVGIALCLAGIGFVILALVVLGKQDEPAAT